MNLVLSLVAVIPLLLVSSCSHREKPSPQLEIISSNHFDVSVSSAGKEVQNFETELVHRLPINRSALKTFGPNGLTVLRDYDSAGKVKGLRIAPASKPQLLTLLGFKEGDSLTAVDTIRLTDPAQIDLLFLRLEAENLVTMTVDRAGLPHKFYYSAE